MSVAAVGAAAAGAAARIEASRVEASRIEARVEERDVEWIVHWALGRSGKLPWHRTGDAVLSYDGGLTARPKRRPPGSWALAEACAGLRLGNGRPLPAMATPSGDTAVVIAAIRRLPPRQAALVLANGRAGRRPEWRVDGKAAAARVTKWVTCKKRKKRRLASVWDVDPQAIRVARAAYGEWHAGMTRLARVLSGALSGFAVNGLAAPAEPWAAAGEKTA